MANQSQAALYSLREGIFSLDEEVEPRKGIFRPTLVTPFGICSGNNLISHPSSVDP
jgi:hypothetical protein